MLIFSDKAGLKTALNQPGENPVTIGFVPTMGALHNGHLSLMQQSVKENDTTVVSIFVNPTQFNNPEDLEKYPRTIDADIEKIKTVSDKIILFTPTVSEMYEDAAEPEHFSFDGLEFQMEGAFRPGHFDGVGTIVKKLFEIVKPDNAYFGEKDFQQLQIVRKMVQKENIPVTIVGCPISRETNGLAMSSRNERLSVAQKQEASLIYQILQQAKNLFTTNSVAEVKHYVNEALSQHKEFKTEYFEIADEVTLMPAVIKENKKYRAFIAVFLGNVRLIDNISLN